MSQNRPSAFQGLRMGGSEVIREKVQDGLTGETKEMQYTQCKIVGNGSFGVVFQTKLSPSGEDAAIKRVLQDKRFKNRELQIMRIVRHPNIVELKAFYYSNGDRVRDTDARMNVQTSLIAAQKDEVYLNLVLEFVPETVYRASRHFNKLKSTMPILEVKLYIYQLFRSLAYIHSQGICHRDIKPQNLLLDPASGILKLCDFGSAKILVENEPNVSYICSRYYRAPELIFGATNYTTKIDVWSTGCVMAELMLGQPLFPGESGIDQLVEIIKVLGTPTRDQIRTMNPNYMEHKFPQIKPHPFSRVITPTSSFSSQPCRFRANNELMSPSSSAAVVPSHARNRGSSNATPIPDASSTRPSRISSRPGSPADTSALSSAPTPHYTVFIRLPFARGDFQDPAPTNWTAAKDRQLWKLISKSQSGDLNWAGLSQEFDVELNFLLMQAAWLSERHMERMRRQVTKIGGAAASEGTTGSGTGSSVGGVKMERTASRESKLRSGSTSTAVRRGSPSYPIGNEEPGSPITDGPRAGLPPMSRTPSSATVTQSKLAGSRMQQPRSRGLRSSSGSTRKPRPASFAESIATARAEYYEDAVEQGGHSDSGSDSEDEPPSALARSQAFRRPPPTSRKVKPTLADLASEGDDEELGDYDDDDESSNGGHLPFAAAVASKPVDPAATLRKNSPKMPSVQPGPATSKVTSRTPKTRSEWDRERDLPTLTNTTASSQSSASSAAALPGPSSNVSRRRASYDSSSSAAAPKRHGPAAHPLSPRHRAQVASLSPQSKASGSPSMGSSFSDLDDASVTQSALEEALMSNMRAQGGSTMASRMSTLRDVLGRGAGRG